MTDLEARLRRDIERYVRTRPVARPPLDELLSRADDVTAAPARRSARSARPRYVLTAAGIGAVAATVAVGVLWRGEPEQTATAAPLHLACAPFGSGVAGEEPNPPEVQTAPDVPDAPAGALDLVVVFLSRDVTDEQRSALTDVFEADPRIAAYDYYDESESVEEFRRLFRRNQAMLDRLEENPDLVPTSYRLDLSLAGHRQVEVVMAELSGRPGVLRVTTASTCE